MSVSVPAVFWKIKEWCLKKVNAIKLDGLPLRSRSKFIFNIILVYKSRWDFKLKIIIMKKIEKNSQLLKWSGECFHMNIVTACLWNETSSWLLHQHDPSHVNISMLHVFNSWKQQTSFSLYSAAEIIGNTFLWEYSAFYSLAWQRIFQGSDFHVQWAQLALHQASIWTEI